MKLSSLSPSRLVLALATAGIVGGTGVTALQLVGPAHAANAVTATTPVTAAVTPMALPDFSRITAQNGPACRAKCRPAARVRASSSAPTASS